AEPPPCGAAPSQFENLDTHGESRRTELQLDYTRPMSGKAKLKLGYLLTIADSASDTSGEDGLTQAAAAPDPTQTDRFRYGLTVNAAYATFEQPLGKWDALLGLR